MSGILYWIVVGLIAGWLAGRVMKGGGYGVVVDIILGMLGGIRGTKSKSRRLPGVGRPARLPSRVTQLAAARSARVAKYHSAVGARWNFKCSSAPSAFFASPDFWRARIRYLMASGECGSAESSSP